MEKVNGNFTSKLISPSCAVQRVELLILGGGQLQDSSLCFVHKYPGPVGFMESINKTFKVLRFLSHFNSNSKGDGWIALGGCQSDL